MIAIIDYGMGNLHSVYNALDFIGEDAVITNNPEIIADAERIILPGVGAFGEAMENIHNKGLYEILRNEVLLNKKPFLGICLGMQLVADYSEENGFHKGLGFIKGHVKHFQLEKGYHIPHIGWNEINYNEDEPFFERVRKKDRNFYFVHSYHFVPDSHHVILSTTKYGQEFVSAVKQNNIVATQFHPEKSQKNGLNFLEAFVEWEPVLEAEEAKEIC